MCFTKSFQPTNCYIIRPRSPKFGLIVNVYAALRPAHEPTRDLLQPTRLALGPVPTSRQICHTIANGREEIILQEPSCCCFPPLPPAFLANRPLPSHRGFPPTSSPLDSLSYRVLPYYIRSLAYLTIVGVDDDGHALGKLAKRRIIDTYQK